MGQSLSQILVHLIFSTKLRENWLNSEIAKEFEPYAAQVLHNLQCPVLHIKAMPDHIHILCFLAKSITVETLLERMKSTISGRLKKKSPSLREFRWQAGYAAFSVSPSNLERVRPYIENQELHHQKKSFQDELREFFRWYEVDYDERYVWD